MYTYSIDDGQEFYRYKAEKAAVQDGCLILYGHNNVVVTTFARRAWKNCVKKEDLS